MTDAATTVLPERSGRRQHAGLVRQQGVGSGPPFRRQVPEEGRLDRMAAPRSIHDRERSHRPRNSAAVALQGYCLAICPVRQRNTAFPAAGAAW